jgi:hypothetical protein
VWIGEWHERIVEMLWVGVWVWGGIYINSNTKSECLQYAVGWSTDVL